MSLQNIKNCFPRELKVIIGLKWVKMDFGTETRYFFKNMMTSKKKKKSHKDVLMGIFDFIFYFPVFTRIVALW